MNFFQIMHAVCAAYIIWLAFMIKPTGSSKVWSILLFVYIPIMIGLVSLINSYAQFMGWPL